MKESPSGINEKTCVICRRTDKSGFGGVFAPLIACLSLWERCPRRGRRGPPQSRLTPCQLPQRGSQGCCAPSRQLSICRSVTGRGAQGQLYLVPNVRNALAAGLARQIPIYLTAEDFGQQKISASCAPLEYRQGVAQANTQTFSLRHFLYILFKFIPKGYHNCQLFIVNCQFTKSFFSPLILLGKDERCLK